MRSFAWETPALATSSVSVDEYVANILASAPPLTTDTIGRITSILQVVSND